MTHGIMLRAVLYAVLLAPAAGFAAEPALRLYPEIFVAVDNVALRDPSLAAFVADLARAADATIEIETVGKVYDPTALAPFLADTVEVFVGEKRADISAEFRSAGLLPAFEALALAGRLYYRETVDPLVDRRHGMVVIEQLLWQRTIGATPWLGGRVCTAGYGRLAPQRMDALAAETGVKLAQWVIAIGRPVADIDAGDALFYPPAWQVLPRSNQTRRDGGWVAILTPWGDTAQFRNWPWKPAFASYLNDHLCFEKRADGWKIVAFAIRQY